jgi:hypothetical protein
MNENDFIDVGIIEEWVNQNIKVGQLASFLFHHFWLCPMCESILELGLQQLLFVVEEIILSWIYMKT